MCDDIVIGKRPNSGVVIPNRVRYHRPLSAVERPNLPLAAASVLDRPEIATLLVGRGIAQSLYCGCSYPSQCA